MRNFIVVLSFIMICSFSSAQAVEPVSDHQMMLYYQIPLGADKEIDKKHKFGLRIDRTMHDPREVTDFGSVMKKPAMFDLQFRHKQALAFKVHGVDYTERLYVQRADAAGDAEATEVVEEVAAEEDAGAEAEQVSEGEATEADVSKEEEEKKPEKTIVQKKLDELPMGVVGGAIIGLIILAGIGG